MKLLRLLAVVLVVSGCQSLQPSSPPSPKTILVNGTTLAYLEQGTGTPVVFLHGAFSDHRIWETQREAVAGNYRFIALSMRYFGTAPWPDNGAQFSQATHVADVAAFIRELKLGPVYLVGRSYGASIAVVTALRHPELLRGLFLNEPPLVSALTAPADRTAAAEDLKGLATVREAVKAGDNNRATRLFADFVNNDPGGFDASASATRAMHLDNARTVPLTLSPASPAIPVSCEQLGQLKIPVAITKGELTRPFLRLAAEGASRCLPGSQLITIKGARHGAPNQQPAAFNEALLAFLARR